MTSGDTDAFDDATSSDGLAERLAAYGDVLRNQIDSPAAPGGVTLVSNGSKADPIGHRASSRPSGALQRIAAVAAVLLIAGLGYSALRPDGTAPANEVSVASPTGGTTASETGQSATDDSSSSPTGEDTSVVGIETSDADDSTTSADERPIEAAAESAFEPLVSTDNADRNEEPEDPSAATEGSADLIDSATTLDPEVAATKTANQEPQGSTDTAANPDNDSNNPSALTTASDESAAYSCSIGELVGTQCRITRPSIIDPTTPEATCPSNFIEDASGCHRLFPWCAESEVSADGSECRQPVAAIADYERPPCDDGKLTGNSAEGWGCLFTVAAVTAAAPLDCGDERVHPDGDRCFRVTAAGSALSCSAGSLDEDTDSCLEVVARIPVPPCEYWLTPADTCIAEVQSLTDGCKGDNQKGIAGVLNGAVNGTTGATFDELDAPPEQCFVVISEHSPCPVGASLDSPESSASCVLRTEPEWQEVACLPDVERVAFSDGSFCGESFRDNAPSCPTGTFPVQDNDDISCADLRCSPGVPVAPAVDGSSPETCDPGAASVPLSCGAAIEDVEGDASKGCHLLRAPDCGELTVVGLTCRDVYTGNSPEPKHICPVDFVAVNQLVNRFSPYTCERFEAAVAN